MKKIQYNKGETPTERLRNLLSPTFNLIEMLKTRQDDRYFDNNVMNNIFLKNLQTCVDYKDSVKNYLGDIENFYEKKFLQYNLPYSQ